MKKENRPVLILVSGKSHAGKGEFSRRLEDVIKRKPVNVIRCSLSTYVRKILVEDFYFDGKDTDESREFMGEVYRLGTKVYPYHMARRLWERDIRPYVVSNSPNFVIVESFREMLNYDYFQILQKEGKIKDIVTVRIERPDHISTGESMENHISEINLDNFDFDYHVTNETGNLSKLDEQVKVISNNMLDTLGWF